MGAEERIRHNSQILSPLLRISIKPKEGLNGVRNFCLGSKKITGAPFAALQEQARHGAGLDRYSHADFWVWREECEFPGIAFHIVGRVKANRARWWEFEPNGIEPG